jgi:hypothetical protein
VSDDPDLERVLGVLAARGLAAAQDLQQATGKSQPTVSRLLARLSDRVLTLGRARATRYGLPKSIHGLPAQQPIHWTDERGSIRRIGTLTLLAGDLVHVDTVHASGVFRGELPWFLAPLQAQGFLGRLLARRLAPSGIGSNPEGWGVDSVLFAATHLHDAPGAISLGDPMVPAELPSIPAEPKQAAEVLDGLAGDVARLLPAGSSAGGEQPKFLARTGVAETGHGVDVRHVLVKFSPPRTTPFGARWRDLLHAEALASEVLGEHGVPVARTRIVETPSRTFLVSERFDRIGASGRRHVVAVGAVHRAFVADAWRNWSATCELLAGQQRLSRDDAERVSALLQFGRLIGNSDMHSGNLGLVVAAEDLSRGRFGLAPVYDMLPMRWRPDATLGGAADYGPFEPDPVSLAGSAAGPAVAYWSRLAGHRSVSVPLQRVAAEMAARIARSRA